MTMLHIVKLTTKWSSNLGKEFIILLYILFRADANSSFS